MKKAKKTIQAKSPKVTGKKLYSRTSKPSSKNGMIVLSVLTIAIVLTVLSVQNQQVYVQRAQTPSETPSTVPSTVLSLNPSFVCMGSCLTPGVSLDPGTSVAPSTPAANISGPVPSGQAGNQQGNANAIIANLKNLIAKIADFFTLPFGQQKKYLSGKPLGPGQAKKHPLLAQQNDQAIDGQLAGQLPGGQLDGGAVDGQDQAGQDPNAIQDPDAANNIQQPGNRPVIPQGQEKKQAQNGGNIFTNFFATLLKALGLQQQASQEANLSPSPSATPSVVPNPS